MKYLLKIVKSMVFILILSICAPALFSAWIIVPEEREALTDLYYSTNGDSWTNHSGWLGPDPLPDDEYAPPPVWHGVAFATFDGGKTYTVTGIFLHTNNLSGSIPNTIYKLSNLQTLHLYSNQLSGEIPWQVGNLSNLTTLYLQTNQLTGSIPADLGELSHLTELILQDNQLTGFIPPSLGNLSNLTNLDLGDNQLTGDIPEELGNLNSLRSLYLYMNQLTGSIPDELGRLNSLEILYLFANQLTGNIPTSFNGLVNLQSLWLRTNQLSGSIPEGIGSLSHLTYLDLQNNQLTGNIPAELGYLANLTLLDLGDNRLAGNIPAALGNLINLQSLYLYSNQLIGSIPTSLTNLTQLKTGQTEIHHNALYSSDDDLTAFLDSKDPDWAQTQTIAPTDVQAVPGDASVTISWSPILYTGDTGGYRVYVAEEFVSLIGPYVFYAQTADKSESSLLVNGLTNGHTYYFKVQTRTDAHTGNKSTVESEFSDAVVATPTGTWINALALTSPNGGEGWRVGSAHDITWTTTGTVADVKLEYSTDGGTEWTTIAESTPNTDSYYWTVPNTPSTSCLIRVSEVSAGIPWDVSNAMFTISAFAPTERQSLIDLYNATNGDFWANNSGWKTPPLDTDGFALPGTESTWYGVTTDAGVTTVQQLNLADNILVGYIPASLGNLSNLTHLVLRTNQLTGTIPTELGNLTKLQQLLLHQNLLSGEIPPQIGNASSLKVIDFNTNQLTGSIPVELGNLSNLTDLVLTSNQFTGSIPTELSNLGNLQVLKIGDNQLSGSIPTQLGNLSNLTYLGLNSNQLTGAIPPQLGNLANLYYLGLQDNQLTGGIPSEFGGLSNLQYLVLRTNQLTGEIPMELGNLGNLRWLYLHTNQLSGGIPAQIGNLTNLTDLDLHSNMFAEEIPSGLVNLAGLDPAKTNIGYNGLYSTDPALTSFLDSKDADWAATQTIPPSNVSAVGEVGEALVSWTPIAYAGDAGGYRVFYSTTAGGPYVFYAQTADKTASSQLVSGLTGGIPYYFVVQTRTDAHANNQNVVDSVYSLEATATPLAASITVTSPNGGETWAAGQIYDITWTTSGTVADVKLEYSTDGGAGWTTIVDSTANTGTYAWTVPAVASTNGFVRVSDAGAPAISDTSDAAFTIGTVATIQRQALIALYNATNGDSWTDHSGWKTPPLDADGFAMPGTEGTWFGITEDAASIVTTINLRNNNLVGYIPSSLGNLGGLQVLDLRTNQLSGSIPIELANLSNLTQLSLHNNQLTGGIPSEFGGLTNLVYLVLLSNQLTGTIPMELGNLTNLKQLLLHHNPLSGEIPPQIGNMSSLEVIDFNSCQLTGAVPAELGNLTNLTDLVLYSNMLEGNLPVSMTNLTKLNVLRIRYNALSSTDATLTTFLNSKDADWAKTQTVAPTGVTAAGGNGAALVSWTPVTYTWDTGGYRIYYGTTAGGPYVFYAQTADKTVSSQLVSGLTNGLPHYFVVQTRTNAHTADADPTKNNANVVDSGFSSEAAATPVYGILAVTSPNGGEVWDAGSTHDITWTTDGTVGEVKLEYSTNNGSSWTTIISSTPSVAASGSDAPMSNGYAWVVPAVDSTTCLVRISEVDGLPADASDAVFTIQKDKPIIGLSKTSFNFASVKRGKTTPPDFALITNPGTGTLRWTAASSAAWLVISPKAGPANKKMTIKVANLKSLAVGTYTGTVTITDPNAVNSPAVIDVALEVKEEGTDAFPFGEFETPADGATINAPTTVISGWALDDIGMKWAKIYRKVSATKKALVGTAKFIVGARPDIETDYPTYPQNNRAGWSLTLKMSKLPNKGIGTFVLMAYVQDIGGNQLLLGTHTITGTTPGSGAAAEPFGDLDAPEDGATISGSANVINGWALAPASKSIASSGLAIWIDGMAAGRPEYGASREDVAGGYPGFANSGRAGGSFVLDATKYSDGWHTLAWSARDSSGSVGGIGSRYIKIQNGKAEAASNQAEKANEKAADEEASPVVGSAGPASQTISEIASYAEDGVAPIFEKHGYSDDQAAEAFYPEADGAIRLSIPQASRLAIFLDRNQANENEAARMARTERILAEERAGMISGDESSRYRAFALVGEELRPLPIGASFDSRDGILFWQPGPGFLGEHRFVIVDTETMTKRTIIIKITNE